MANTSIARKKAESLLLICMLPQFLLMQQYFYRLLLLIKRIKNFRSTALKKKKRSTVLSLNKVLRVFFARNSKFHFIYTTVLKTSLIIAGRRVIFLIAMMQWPRCMVLIWQKK